MVYKKLFNKTRLEKRTLLHQITFALDNLLEDVTLLKSGSNVVLSSTFSRTRFASPLIHRKSLTYLEIKSWQVSQRTDNPVYFVKNDKCNSKEYVSELAWNARELNLSPSPFYNPKAAKKLHRYFVA